MTINGLPLHPLIVHATVVLVPVTALLAVLYVARPRLQERLRLPLLALSLATAALVWLTVSTGINLDHQLHVGGQVADLIHRHRTWAVRLEYVTFGFTAVALATALLDRRLGWLRGLLHALLLVGAVAMVVLVVATGDAGAKAVWSGVLPSSR